MTGLLHSPALPAPPHLVRTRHSVRTQAVRGRGGTSACASPAGTQSPGWHPVGSPDPLGREGGSSHAPQHSTPPTAEGACCPGHGLPLPWSGTVDKDLENHGGERRHPGPVWSRGSLRGPALNPSELQSLHAGTLGSAKSPLARPCETGIWKALSSPPARALDKWELLLPPLKSHLHIRGPALWRAGGCGAAGVESERSRPGARVRHSAELGVRVRVTFAATLEEKRCDR